MKLSTKAKGFTKAQMLGLAIMQGGIAICLMLLAFVPMLVAFGGAYENVFEFAKLSLKLYFYVAPCVMGLSVVPFIIFTFIKGLLN